MTSKSSLPGVHVDQDRIEEFLNGIYGPNKTYNSKAKKRGLIYAAVWVASKKRKK